MGDDVFTVQRLSDVFMVMASSSSGCRYIKGKLQEFPLGLREAMEIQKSHVEEYRFDIS